MIDGSTILLNVNVNFNTCQFSNSEIFLWSAINRNTGQAVERRAGLVGPTTQAVVFHMTPILGALIGIVATLIIVAVVIVFIVRTREREDGTPSGSASKLSAAAHISKSINQLNAEQSGTAGSQPVNKRDPTSELLQQNDEEHNPDVVPNKNGTSTTVLLLVLLFSFNSYGQTCV